MKPATLLPPVCALAIGALWLVWEKRTLSELNDRTERLKIFVSLDGSSQPSGKGFRMPERAKPGYTNQAGKPDWKKITRKVASMPNARPNAFYTDIGLAVAMEQMLKTMSAQEISTAMDEVEAMDASDETKAAILDQLGDRLAGLDPQLMLSRFPKVSDSPHGGPYFMPMTNALEAWAGKDGPAAAAWLDGMAAAGQFQRRGLDGTNLLQATFEAALISSGNATTAADRIVRMNPDELEKVLSCWQFKLSDTNRQAILDQIRGGGAPAEKQIELLVQATKSFRAGPDSLAEVGKFVNESATSPAEKTAMIAGAFENAASSFNFDLDAVRAWAATEAPGEVDTMTGQALGNVAQYGDFMKAAKTLLNLQEKNGGGDEALAAFLASPGAMQNPEAALALLGNISDPVKREALRPALEAKASR